MRKIVCRLRLNEVSRQWRRRPKLPPNASCSCISCSPTGCPPRGEVGRRPASGRSSRQGMSPPHGCGGRSHGSAARSRCWYGCGSNARWENRSRSAFPLYNFLGHSLLSPFRMVCGNFILPEPASYVFFYAFSNLRNLLYIIQRVQSISNQEFCCKEWQSAGALAGRNLSAQLSSLAARIGALVSSHVR